MFILPKPLRVNVKSNDADQDDVNSSSFNSFDEDNYRSSFDLLDQFGAPSDALSWGAWFYRVDTGSQPFAGWGAGFAPSLGFASGDPSSPSLSAASASSPGGFTPTISTPSLASSTSPAPTFSPDDSTVEVSSPGSSLVFINTYESSCTAQFEACIVAAEDQLESLFTNFAQLGIEFNEQYAPGASWALENTAAFDVKVSYAQLESKLPTSDKLPSTDPSGGAGFDLPEAYANMLGLSPDAQPFIDDTVTLNTADNWTFGQDVINGVTHELTEGAMGRIGGLGDQGGVWGTMDLFRYTASGVPDYTDGRDGQTTYFSSSGGLKTSAPGGGKGAPVLSFANDYYPNGTPTNAGDVADWTQKAVFGSTQAGETLTLTNTELEVMEALGWNLSLKQDVFDEGIGGWETPADWSTGSMPITPQDAYISGSLVTLNSNVTVNSIATSADTTFGIGNSTSSTLIATNGTFPNMLDASRVASGNLGTTYVDTGSALEIGDAFDNVGAVGVGKGAGGSGGGLLYLADPVTLNGGGTLTLGVTSSGSGFNYGDIEDAPGTSGDGLINVNNTITGGGTISVDSFDNQSGGTVEASQSGGYSLKITAATFTNEGVLEAESGATLAIDSNVGTSEGGLIEALSGGTVILSAAVAAGITNYIYAGGAEYIDSGGSAYGTQIYDFEDTAAGGVDSATYVGSGGTQSVYGSSYKATIAASGNQYVEPGGFTYGTDDYWNQTVEAGGQTDFTSALGEGSQYVWGNAYSAYVSGGGVQWVESGGGGNGTSVNSVGYQVVKNGGEAYYTSTYSLGTMEVESGGFSSGADVYSGGTEYTYAGGIDSATAISSGGLQYVYGDSYSATIAPSGYQYVESGGLAYGIADHGNQTVYSGGETKYTSALSGGDQYVSGGTAEYTTVSSGGGQYVYSGGLGFEDEVYSGGFEEVLSGGAADYTDVAAGGDLYNFGSSYGADIDGAGYTFAGFVDSSTTIGSAGVQYVSGRSYHDSIEKGGNQGVYSGGTAYYSNISAGGAQFVYSGGLAYADGVTSGGFQEVVAGGIADYDYVFAGGDLYNYGSSYAANIYGVDYTEAGGVDNASLISGGANQTVLKVGVAYYDEVASGGTQYDYGITSGTAIVKGGAEDVYSGGVADYSKVYGVELVSSGGSAYGDTVYSGGQVYVYSGGVDSASLISSGGAETVSKGGVTYYDAVASGGAQYDYGVTSDTIIENGGAEDVYSGGSADYSQVHGAEFVSSGGTGFGDTVYSGGALTVSSGGAVAGSMAISGGYVGISGSVASGQDIRFAGTGDLAFYDLAAFHATIGGYSTGDEFDLGGFGFGASETRSFTENAAHTGGTLSVVDGSKTATLSLLGSYVASDFTLSNDLHGGTFVKFV